MPGLRTLKRHGYLFLGTLAVIVIAVGIGMVLVNQQSLIISIDSLRQRHDLTLLLWRLFLYAGLIVYWPRLIAKISRKPRRVSITRWPVTACIVAHELIVAQNGLAILIHGLTS